MGLPTLRDILAELEKPGRDPREQFETFAFAEGVHALADLEPGMELPGVVTNVTAFGAFVDVGVHQDGLVHVSELADRFVRNPHEIVKVHDRVRVMVLGVDLERKRIALSMRKTHGPKRGPSEKNRARKRTASGDSGSRSPAFNNPFAALGRKHKAR